MLGKIDLKSNNCNFEQCQNYEDGKCLNKDDRRNCLEIAMAVLCIDTENTNDGR